MNGLTIIKDGVRYEVPPEIEGKGDRAVAAWVESASAQEARHAEADAASAETPSPKKVRAPKTPTQEG